MGVSHGGVSSGNPGRGGQRGAQGPAGKRDLEIVLTIAARVAFGGISYKPWRSREAEAALVGARVTRASFDAAGIAALRDARGYGHNDFKIPLARRTLRATLADAVGLV